MASQVVYIRILESVDTTVPVEVPLERDNTLLLSTVVAQCPGAVGLRFRSNTGAWRGLKTLGENIHAPPQGWGTTSYYVVYENSTLSKRGAGKADISPAFKATKLTDVLSDGDTVFQKAVQARLEKLQADQWRKIPEIPLQQQQPQPTTCTVLKTEQDRRRAGQQKRVKYLERKEQIYEPTLPQKRGFQIVYKAFFNNDPGRPTMIAEALQVLRRYSSKVYCTGDDPSYLEVRRLENAERDLIFVETDMKDPSMLTDALYLDLLSGNCHPAVLDVVKRWTKFTPIDITSTSDHQDIVRNTKEVVRPLLQQGHCNRLMFRLCVPGNAHRDIYRLLKFKEFNDFLLSHGVSPECWCNSSEYCIFVRVCDNICFISLLNNFTKFKGYSVTDIYNEIAKNGAGADPSPLANRMAERLPYKTNLSEPSSNTAIASRGTSQSNLILQAKGFTPGATEGGAVGSQNRNFSSVPPLMGVDIAGPKGNIGTGLSEMPGLRLQGEKYETHTYRMQQQQQQSNNLASSYEAPRSKAIDRGNNFVNRSQYCVIS